MRIKSAGRIDEGFWFLGTQESCVYLLEGSRSSALINAGLSHILPEYLYQISEWGIDKNKIQHIIMLHAHFDHVGLVPYLKRHWPQLSIYASSLAWEVLANPKALSVINDFMLKVCQRVQGKTDGLSSFDWQWRDDVQGEPLKQGSRIDLGDRHIEIHETPGHSSCSISAYVPELKALFPSDAVAIPYRDEYVIAAGSSFERYQQSLDKLALLDVEMVCADHYGYITGDEAGHYVARSKSAVEQMVDRLRRSLDKHSSVEQASKELVDLHFQQRPDYFVHPDILLRTYTQMLKQLAGI